MLVSSSFLILYISWDHYQKLPIGQSGVLYLLCGSLCYYWLTVFSSCGAEGKLCHQSHFSIPALGDADTATSLSAGCLVSQWLHLTV